MDTTRGPSNQPGPARQELSRLCGGASDRLPLLQQLRRALNASGDGRFATPEASTPKHLIEKILVSRTALEGKRKLAGVEVGSPTDIGTIR